MIREPMTILLVEDDPNDVLLIKRAFQISKIINPVSVVDNGEEAVRYLSGVGKYADRKEFPVPFLILLDLKLPRMSGLEVLEWVKEDENLRKIPVVVLTSSRENVDINKAYELGVNSYLIKPVEFDNLLELVKSLNMYWMILNEAPEVN